MTRRRLPNLTLRVALAPIVATAPGTALIVYAHDAGWAGGLVLGAFLVAVVPMVVIWMVVDAMITAPLRMILHVVYRFTDGDFSARADARGTTEVDAILRALDDLAGKLHTIVSTARLSEQRYRLLVEHNPAGMFRTRVSDGRVLDCNPAAVRMLGYASVVEAQTHRAEDFYADPRDRTTLIAALSHDEAVATFELRMRRKDGADLPVLLSVSRSDHRGEPCLEGQFVPVVPREVSQDVPALTGGRPT
jgi:PAS domain S-box-containing protein